MKSNSFVYAFAGCGIIFVIILFGLMKFTNEKQADSQLSAKNVGIDIDVDVSNYLTVDAGTMSKVHNVGPDLDADSNEYIIEDMPVQNIGPDLNAEDLKAEIHIIGFMSKTQYVGEDIDVDNISYDETITSKINVGENIDVNDR